MATPPPQIASVVHDMVMRFMLWRREKEWQARIKRDWSNELLDEDTDEMLDRVARK